MRKLFERFQQEIAAFIEQRDDLLMVVPCTDADAPLVAQSVGDVEQANGTDVFLVFPDPYVMPGPYVDVVVERLREQHALANKALEEESRPPFPPLPADLADARRPPDERLREAIAFAHALVPEEGGHRLVWALVPMEIQDRVTFLKLVSTLMPWEGVEPWMRGVRLVVRDAPITPAVAERYARAPRLRVRPVDFGPEALEESMQEAVEDESRTDEERMSTLLSLALLDYAHNRFDAAFDKYQTLLGYYQHTGDRAMQAFVLSGLGDLNHRNDLLEEAKHWYECALVPLTETPSPVVLFSVLKNLGLVAYKQGDFATAERYFEMVDEVATQMRDAEGKAWALEWRGRSQEQQGAFGEAVESWNTAATLSRNVGMDPNLKANLEHLERTYAKARMSRERAEVAAELSTLDGEAAP